MSENLFRLVYCSRYVTPSQPDEHVREVESILSTSRANNARDSVTGALLFSNGCFAQVLEGELDAVQQTFERIQRDERHRHVVVLEARAVAGRLFGAWDMALAEAADPTAARAVLACALSETSSDAGTTVIALLDGLVRRECDWAGAA